MAEFWEESFLGKQEMWGFEPAQSAIVAKDLFVAQRARHILVPGIGYGRNAQLFRENGMQVTGIEISATAIELARKYFGSDLTIYHGSVSDMPFDNTLYDGIFCYALIHLLDTTEREKLIQDCYNQLAEGGHMIFTAISKKAATYGKGKYISPDRFELHQGVQLYFYDRDSVAAAFGRAGLIDVAEIEENFPFFLITCRKD